MLMVKVDREERSLRLASELREELAAALDSLAGKQRNGLFDSFLVYSALHINRV